MTGATAQRALPARPSGASSGLGPSAYPRPGRLGVPPDVAPDVAHRAADEIRVDRDTRTAYADGRPLELTYLEFELLAYFASHPMSVHRRDTLLRQVWGYGETSAGGRAVDVLVTRLRRKLGPDHRASIETVRRVGYRYRPRRLGTCR